MLRSKSFLLNLGEVPPGCESIAKVVSAGKGEYVWVLIQEFKDRAHIDQVMANVMQDKSISDLVKDFYAIISPGQQLVNGDLKRV